MSDDYKPLDVVALWRALPSDLQLKIGAAALAVELSAQGSTTPPPAHPASQEDRDWWIRYTDRQDTAGDEARGFLQDLLAENLVHAYGDDGLPHHLDLNSLGIRQCTSCGCTNDHACSPPCGWKSATLCTSCAGEPDAA